MSTHPGDNILFDLDYGANKFGITLATPADMMHASYQICKQDFCDEHAIVSAGAGRLPDREIICWKPSVREQSFLQDELQWRRLQPHNAIIASLAGNDHGFPCVATDKRGFFAFKDGEEGPEPDYEWDAAPSLNVDKAYKPPIIREDDENATAIRNDNDEDGSNSEVDDDALSDEEWMCDTDQDDDDDFVIESRKKKKIEKKTMPMQCSYQQFLNLLQELLSFHAWYRYGDPPFDHNPEQERIDSVQILIRWMIARIIT
jgi:hypothetical protein